MFSRPPRTQEEWEAHFRLMNGISLEEHLKQQQRAIENSRLHMIAPTRITLAFFASFGVGTALGIKQASTMAGLRFRAEHAHKLPTTPTGWFMYHKSKNYNMARASLREGIKMGAKVSFWTTAMFSIEYLYDTYREANDFVNTVMASLTVAGGFSVWNKFSLAMTARTTKTALVVGLIYGGLQDAVGVARGRRIGYVDWLRSRFRSSAHEQATNPS